MIDASLPAKTLIVGSKGRMGGMLLAEAHKNGLCAIGVDRPFDQANLAETCADTALALLCVPARHLEKTARLLAPHLPPDCVLADITSVKEGPMRQMEACWPGPVVGTHPLFGPKHAQDADLPVAIARGARARPRHMAMVEAFFTAIGCRVFECGAAEHDEAMAKIQNMNFITNLAYFAAVAGQEDLLPFLTPSFERRKNAAAKMLNEDAEMFAGLFEANAHSHEAVRQYRKMLNLAASGDIELLCRRAQWWWRQDGKNLCKEQGI